MRGMNQNYEERKMVCVCECMLTRVYMCVHVFLCVHVLAHVCVRVCVRVHVSGGEGVCRELRVMKWVEACAQPSLSPALDDTTHRLRDLVGQV